MANGNKGQMRIVEVILASFVIVFALSFANILAIVPTSPKYEATELEKLGYNVLYDLDKQGLLPRFVYNGEWENLTAALRVSLPLDVHFNMTIYYLNGTKVAHKLIFYGDVTTFITSKNVASVTYGLVGCPIKINATHYQASYDPRILILQLTRG
jgi:hypothetical protein